MITLTEIQGAIIALPEEERQALSVWLESQRPVNLNAEDEKRLLESLDQAVRDMDAGKGVPLSDARKLVRSWAGK